jgi:hypothetical protein
LRTHVEAHPSCLSHRINGKTFVKSQEWKLGQKYLWKSRKIKTFQHIDRGDSIKTHRYIDANPVFIRCGNHPYILPLFGRLGRSLTSLLSPLWLEKWRPKANGVGEGYLPQQPYGSIYNEDQKTRMPLWAKSKITTNER